MVIKYEPEPTCFSFCIDCSTDEDFIKEINASGQVVVSVTYASKTSLRTSLYTKRHSRILAVIPEDCKDLKFRVTNELGGLDLHRRTMAYFKVLKKQGKAEWEYWLKSCLKSFGISEDTEVIVKTNVWK